MSQQTTDLPQVTLTTDGLRRGHTPGMALKRLANAIEAAGRSEATAIRDDDGNVTAIVMPPEEWHDPQTCCCKNCPWGGDHHV